MKLLNPKLIILILFSYYGIAHANPLMDDTSHTKTAFYVPPAVCIRGTAGLGFTNISVGAIASIRLDIKNIFLSYRYCATTEIFPENDGLWKSAEDYSWIIGYSYMIEGYYISIGTGIGKVYTVSSALNFSNGSSSSESYDIKNSVTGLPIQIELFNTGKVIGGGLVLFANINKLHNIFGAAICIQMGRLN